MWKEEPSVGGRRIFPLFVSLLFIVALVACGAPSDVGSNTAPPARLSKEQTFSRLLTIAQDRGSAKVIVKMRPRQGLGIAAQQDQIIGSLAAHQPKGVKRFATLPYVAMAVNANALNALSHNPNVEFIGEDIQMSPTLDKSSPFIGAVAAWNAGYDGSGQTVAILDTGVNGSHKFLQGKVVSEACFSYDNPSSGYGTTCPDGSELQTGAGAGKNCSLSYYGCTHGTHVAGIAAGYLDANLAGVAPGADVIAIQVFTYDTYYNSVVAFTSDILLGLERVDGLSAFYNISSANLSLGSGAYSGTHCDSADGGAMKSIVDRLKAKGIATVIASGNDSDKSRINWPACVSSAVSVGATNTVGSSTENDVAYFSNSAPILDLLAPGVSIYSSIKVDTYPFTSYVYGKMSGTSMAAPQVTGAWAVMKQATGGTVDAILYSLQANGLPITDTNGVTTRRIQVDNALGIGQTPSAFTSHADGDTLTGASETFVWSDIGAQLYSVIVGTGVGKADIAYINNGTTATSYTFTNLPTDGSTLYVRLRWWKNGFYNFVDYTFTTATIAPPSPGFASHADGDTLTGAAETFVWNDVGADLYSVIVGTNVGWADITYINNGTTGTSYTFTNLPTDGSTIYVRLRWWKNGVYDFLDYAFTAATIEAPPPAANGFTSHADGDTLTGATETFVWSDVGADLYSVLVGTNVGWADITYINNGTTGTSYTFTNLPTDGSTLYVRLRWWKNGVYDFLDYAFTAATIAPPPAGFTSHADGDTLTGATETFVWNDVGADLYSVLVGTNVGWADITYINNGTTGTSYTFTNLPTDGSTIYVRLRWWKNGVYDFLDYAFTAATIEAPPPAANGFTSHADGDTLTGATETFVWSDVGADLYSVIVGTGVGKADIAYINNGTTATTYTFTSLPTDGSTIYVRLRWWKSGVYDYLDYAFITHNVNPPVMISPVPGNTLTGSTETFTWQDQGADLYSALVGTSLGGWDIDYINNGTTATSFTFTSLPTDGSAVYVRLRWWVGGVYHARDYSYTAFE
jgi:subtilisin family serine protease